MDKQGSMMSSIDQKNASNVAHVLITRFNLPTPGPESLIRARDGWLRSRWELFNRYTVPSVQRQTLQSFSWLVYFDEESPEWLKREVAAQAEAGLYIPLFRVVPTAESIADDIQQLVPRRSELITTNLDNDDGLAVDFIARLQAHRIVGERAAIYFKRGLIRTDSSVFLRTDMDNAFCSVREPWINPMTCWIDWHVLLGKHMPVARIGGQPAWLQVVHGTNVSNRVKGRLVSPVRYREIFPRLLEDVTPPELTQLIADRAVAGPARWLRNAVRVGARRAIMAIGGKEGLDRIKEASTKAKSSLGLRRAR